MSQLSSKLLWSHLDHVTPGSSYFCLSRHRPAAHAAIIKALQKGAAQVFSMFDIDEPRHHQWPTQRAQQRQLIDDFYGPLPHNAPKIIAVTGTNGKSSTTCLLQTALEQAGYPTTLIGTLGIRYHSTQTPVGNNLTTPDYADLRAYIALACQKGHQYVVMEASSHALSQYRLGSLPIFLAAATAITCDDHIEYHGSAHAYIKAKGVLFDYFKPTMAVLPSPHHLWPYVNQHSAARSYIPTPPPQNAPLPVQWQWLNIQLSQAILQALQLPAPSDLNVWVKNAAVTGRFQATPWSHGRTAWVDFAHTPHALEHALHPWQRQDLGPLWVVIGAGGRRDRAKRPQLLRIALQYARFVIITEDNPRDEPFEQIVADMLQNQSFEDVMVIQDRRHAIAYAAAHAPAMSHIFIAGKGHEQTQIIGSQSFEYSDLKEVQRYACQTLLPAEHLFS